MTRSTTCTVYFDGACPVCRGEIAHYRRQRGSESIAWVDASSCDEAELGPGLDRSVVLSRFYVRNADGTLTSGAAAFVALWRRLPAFAWLAALASSRPALALLEAGYSIFLRVRPWWRPVDVRIDAARMDFSDGRSAHASDPSMNCGVSTPGQEGVIRMASKGFSQYPVRFAGHIPSSRLSTRRSSMFKFKTVLASAVTAAVLATGVSTAVADSMSHSTNMGATPMARADIVDTAVGAGQFNTLAKALTAAGLVDTLKGKGPFTVFAPTDAAFAKLPPAQLNALLADKAALIKVLTYHVVPGEIVAADVKAGPLKTVEGESLNVTTSSMGVKVNDANVIRTDVMASNGVIHVIDTVVVPN